MKTRTIGLTLGMVLFGAVGAAQAAPIAVGPRLFLDLDDGTNFGIGVEGRFAVLQIAPSVRLDVRPFFDYYFVDDDFGDVTLLGFGADALFAFNVGNPVIEPYALAGLNILYASFDVPGGSDSSTDAGFNIGGGARFLTDGSIQPFAELRITIGGDYDPLFLGGGVLFIF